MWFRGRMRAGTRNPWRDRWRRRGVRFEHPRSRAGSRDGRWPSRSLRGRDRRRRDLRGRYRCGRVTLLARSLYWRMERRHRDSGRLRPRRRRHGRSTRFPRRLRRRNRTGRGLRRRNRTGRGRSGSGRHRRHRRGDGSGAPGEAPDRLDRRHRGKDVAHRARRLVPRPTRLDLCLGLESRDVPGRRRRRSQLAPRRAGLRHDGLPLSGLHLAQGSRLLGTLRLAPTSALAVDLLAHRFLNSGTAGASRCTEPRRRAPGTRPVLRSGPARGSPLTRWPMPGSPPG